MVTMEMSQSPPIIPPHDNGTNNHPPQIEVREPSYAELEQEVAQLKLTLKETNEYYQTRESNHDKALAAAEAKVVGVKSLLFEETRKVKEVSGYLIYEQCQYSGEVADLVAEINELENTIRDLKQLNEQMEKTQEPIMQNSHGNCWKCQNNHNRLQETHRSTLESSESASKPKEGNPQRREPNFGEPSSDEYVHPENEESFQNELTTREEHANQTSCSVNNSNMESEQQCKNDILKALDESTQTIFIRDEIDYHLIKIVHNVDSVTFICPDVFHLCFRNKGTGSIIQTKDEGLMTVYSKIPYIQLVEVFLRMLFSNSKNKFAHLLLEMKSENHQPRENISQKKFLRLLVGVFKARDQLLKVRYLYTAKFLLNCIAGYMDPDRCEAITILGNGGEEKEELDREFSLSPIWKKLRRFVSFDEFFSQNIWKQCQHIPKFHVILKDEMKIEEILELKQKLLQAPHLVHVSIYFKSRLSYAFMTTLFANLNQPLPIERTPKLAYFCWLDENDELLLMVDEYSIEFRRLQYMENKLEEEKKLEEEEEDITHKLFMCAIEKMEIDLMIPFIMRQKQEEIFRLIDEYVEERSLNLDDSEEEIKRILHRMDEATKFSDSTATSDEDEISSAPLTASSRDGSLSIPSLDLSETQESNTEVGPGSESEILNSTAMEVDSVVIEALGTTLRDSQDRREAPDDELFVDPPDSSAKRRSEEPIEEQPLSKRMKITEKTLMPEEPFDVPQKEVADSPHDTPQESERIVHAVKGLGQNDDDLGAGRITADRQDRHHGLPDDSVSERLRSLQSIMENSSEEYRRGCLTVLNAAILRFSTPNPPGVASRSFDKMIESYINMSGLHEILQEVGPRSKSGISEPTTTKMLTDAVEASGLASTGIQADHGKATKVDSYVDQDNTVKQFGEPMIIDSTAMEVDSTVIEALGPTLREIQDHRGAPDVDLFVDPTDPSAKRFEEPMEEHSTPKRLKIAEKEPVLEQSHGFSREVLADTPNDASQQGSISEESLDVPPEKAVGAAEGLGRNEDGLEAEQPTAEGQDRQQSIHGIPANSVSERLRSLQSAMERSSEEYRRGCQTVLIAAVSRFSGPNPPESASAFFDEMIRRFRTSPLHNG